MSRRRYVVRRLDQYRKGDKRWVVWDTTNKGWAGAPRTTRRDAQDVCDELEAEAASHPQPEQPPA